MYSSRGIGRQTYNDRRDRDNDRDRGIGDRSNYNNSSDINYRSEDIKPNVYNENEDKNQTSSHKRDSYTPVGSVPSREGGYTPPIPSREGDYTPSVTSREGDYTSSVPLRESGYSPSVSSREGGYTPSISSREVGYTPSISSREGGYTPSVTSREGDYTSSVPLRESGYSPSVSSREGGYTPSVPSREGGYTPSVSSREGGFTPSMGSISSRDSGYPSSVSSRDGRLPPSTSSTTDPHFHETKPKPMESSAYISNPSFINNRNTGYAKEEVEESSESLQWRQKLAKFFHECQTIPELIDKKEMFISKRQQLDQCLAKSALREGDIMRNKRRNRDDFKDPQLCEFRDIQIAIKGKLEEVNKFLVEIDKKIRILTKIQKEALDEELKAKGVTKPLSYEAQCIHNFEMAERSTKADESMDDNEDKYLYETLCHEFIDPGSHWCRNCDKIFIKVNEYLDHLQSKEHFKVTTDEPKLWHKPRPKKPPSEIDPQMLKEKTKVHIKGTQFLIPLKAFYCSICKQYLGDSTRAEEHLKSGKHSRIWQRFVSINMDYERIWNSDKGKATNRHLNHKQRIKDEEHKEIEKKRIKEEIKLKDEKKKRREGERKEKEERDREREEWKKSYKSNNDDRNTKSSDRFRLKTVKDLNDDKNLFSFHKLERERAREKERHKNKKRTRVYSSDSDSSSSPPPKKRTYFGDPYKDPKLERKPFVKLIRLNKKTAKKYWTQELDNILEELKNKSLKTTTIVEVSDSPVGVDIHIDDENEQKEQKNMNCVVDDILKGLDDENEDNNQLESDQTKDVQKSESLVSVDVEVKRESEGMKDIDVSVVPEDKDSHKEDNKENSIENEGQLQIDAEPQDNSEDIIGSKSDEQKDNECSDSGVCPEQQI